MTLALIVLLQSSTLLAIFDNEINRANVPQYRSLFAAQIQQESCMATPTLSHHTHKGLTQFTPPYPW